MQLSLKRQSLFLFFITSLSIVPFSLKANDNEELPPLTQQELQAFLEPTQRALESQLVVLEKGAQDIILEINSGMKVEQESAVREALFHCRQLISQYHQRIRGMTLIDVSELMHVSSFVEQMTACLMTSVISRFKILPVFDETQVRSNIPLDELTIEEVTTAANGNEQEVKTLQNKITYLRLSLTNRFFRSGYKIWDKIKPFVTYGSMTVFVTTLLACQLTNWELPRLRNFKLSFLNKIPLINKIPGIDHIANTPIYGWSAHHHEEILGKADKNPPDFDFFVDYYRDAKQYSSGRKYRRACDELRSKLYEKGAPYWRVLLAESKPLGLTYEAATAAIRWQNDYPVRFALAALGVPAIVSELWKSGSKIFDEATTRLRNRLQGYDIELKDDFELTSDKSFEDVIGYEEIKQQLSLHILRFLESPERFTRMGLAPERGWLFTGPSRTGKSFMVKALYGEVDRLMRALGKEKEFVFRHCHSSDIIKLGGIKLITEWFKQQSPCTIIFIDEIDLLNLQRVGNSTVLAEFLTTMSGFMEDNPERQVFIIAATNKPETLDKSLRQHGRFGKEIRFEKPNLKDRHTYLQKRFTELAIDTTHINLDALALYTDGCVFEELESMIREALNKAKAQGLMPTQLLFEEALHSAVHNIVMDKPLTLAPQEHLLIAVHQMGTALAHTLLKSRDQVSLVTTRPIVATLKEEMHYQEFYQSEEHKQKETIYGKVFTFKAQDSVGIETIHDKVTMCKTLLAGYIAEEVILGASSYSYQPENKFKAFQIAKELASKGISQSQLSDELNAKVTQTAWNMLEEYEQELKKMFEEYKPYLTILSSLVVEQNVTGEQIEQILSRPKSEVENILKQINEQAEQFLKQQQ